MLHDGIAARSANNYDYDENFDDESNQADPLEQSAGGYSQEFDNTDDKNENHGKDSPQMQQQQEKEQAMQGTLAETDEDIFEKYVDDHDDDADIAEYMEEDSCPSYVMPDSIAKDLQKVRLSSSGKY